MRLELLAPAEVAYDVLEQIQEHNAILADLGRNGVSHCEVQCYTSNGVPVESAKASGVVDDRAVTVTALREGENSTYYMQEQSDESSIGACTSGDSMRGAPRDVAHDLLRLLRDHPSETEFDILPVAAETPPPSGPVLIPRQRSK